MGQTLCEFGYQQSEFGSDRVVCLRDGVTLSLSRSVEEDGVLRFHKEFIMRLKNYVLVLCVSWLCCPLTTSAQSLREKADAGRPYAIAWGVGRHVYGSQVYDYWHGPYGHVHEHMVDGDKLNADVSPNIYDLSSLGDNGGNQWGPTVVGTGIQNIDGPQRAPHFADLSESDRASILSRDLTEPAHVIDQL